MSGSMDRRGFIRAVGATAAAGGALGRALQPAEAGQFTGKLKKAVKLHMVTADLSVEDKFKMLRDVGFDGVEYRRRDGIEPKKLLRARESSGLPIHGVVNGSDTDLEGAIDLAEYLGGTSVLWVAGRVHADSRYDVNYRETQEVLRKNRDYAEKKGIPILVENVWNNFLLSPMEMARYLDEIDSDHVGAYFDTGNVVRFGWPEHWIRILGSRIGKLDVKEYSRKKQREQGLYKGFDVTLGEGSVDWAAVREALADIGYTGWATRERSHGGREFFEAEAKRMDKVLDL
jgi:hexulose-6-phosphate isomerase